MKTDSSITHRHYLSLAIPFTVSTITQPLLGAVDTAVVGRLDDASYIGGVAIGTVIFNTIYWLFGFLRVATSGFSSQSLGSGKERDGYDAYFRPLMIAMAISGTFLLLQHPIKNLALGFYHPDPDVAPHMMTYFNIVIWGAPFVLTGYVNLGWLMGRRYVKEMLFLQITTNSINITLDILFVTVLKMGVPGVAWATFISQFYGFFIGFFFISKKLNLAKILEFKTDLWNRSAIKKIMSVNTDLFIRTACLLIMTNMFIAKGSQLGTDFLAANAVLFQLQYIIAYFFDGFGNATSVLTGKSVSEKNLGDYLKILNISFIQAAVLSVVFAAAVFIFKDSIIPIFTNIDHIIALCKEYIPWLVLFPLVMGIGLVCYGLYTGATYTMPIRNAQLIALFVFVLAYYTAIPIFNNHGLWLAFILFSLNRTVFLFLYRKCLVRDLFRPEHAKVET